ncbi:type-2 histone deacetylase 1-like isoform X2 [Ruditapes philippinarum]|uniref:type-2 histone deacetylase 1-like isoform X2 n=1 Tax=Ruditapes philippinarum TaxID=129788 RepID=UPI00295BD49D|nr:type-2 histone deacetylase 1-like isoform X2 [Ruditapes philippinarum]
MEFKDVENINKEVIVKIKDIINLADLLHYMEQFGFSLMTIQSIKAEIKNHGEAYAVMNFLDAIKRRPGSFPKFIAALRHSKQADVYKIFMAQIRKHFAKQQTRLAEVLSLISEEERHLGIVEDPDERDNGGNRRNQHTGLQGSSSFSHQSADNQWSTDLYKRENKRESPPKRMSDPEMSRTPVRSSSNLTSSSLSSLTSLDNSLQGATGNTGQSTKNVSPSSNVLDPAYAGAPISTLKAKVYNMLGKALEKTNTHDDDKEPWWEHIINNGDLNISRREQRQIGNHRNPGKAFLDILDERDYTLEDLDRLFVQFRIHEALGILREHQNKVIPENTSSRPKDNNLNRNQTPKVDASKDLNISIPQIDVPPGPNEANTATDVNQTSNDVPNSPSTQRPDSCASTQSLDNNNDCSNSPMHSIEDVPMKGTVAIQACGDPSGLQSQQSSDVDAVKLRNDWVNQSERSPNQVNQSERSPNQVNQSERNSNQVNLSERNSNQGNQSERNSNQVNLSERNSNQVNLSERNSNQVNLSERNRQALEGYSPIHRSESEEMCSASNQREDEGNRNAELNQEQLERNSPPVQGQGDGGEGCHGNRESQSGSSGNLPLLSGLQSMGMDSEIPGENPETQEQRVVNIPPRSLTSYEANVGNVSSANRTQETRGVEFVPPSIESEYSREANEESGFSSGESNVERLNIESISSVNDEATRSLTEPDLLQQTHSAATDNVALDTKPEESKH